jgi:hypothetical protein
MSSKTSRSLRIDNQEDPSFSRRGRLPREEYQRRVRAALATDYATLSESSLCSLPGVVALARGEYARRIFPEAAALRTLLDRACAVALEEVDGLEDKRMWQIAT